MTATPAALPMMRMLPPVPAQNASSCQNEPSTMKCASSVPAAAGPATSYIPMQLATNGTLSTMAETRPMMPVTINELPPDAVSSHSPNECSTPISSSEATVINMPRKNSSVEKSTLRSSSDTRCSDDGAPGIFM